MRLFESNKLPDGIENEWSRRLVEGGDGYMLRNLNDLHFLNKKKYFANDDFRNGEYLRLCKNGLFDE